MLTIKHLTTVIMISLFLVGVNLFIVSTNKFNINDWYYNRVNLENRKLGKSKEKIV